jgi:hypothetical protein
MVRSPDRIHWPRSTWTRSPIESPHSLISKKKKKSIEFLIENNQIVNTIFGYTIGAVVPEACARGV